MQTEEQKQEREIAGYEYWSHIPMQRPLTHTVKTILCLIQDRGYIAGSYAAWLSVHDGCEVHPRPGDIDIFAISAEDAQAIADDLPKVLDGYRITAETDVAYTLECTPLKTVFNESLAIQVVKPNPEWKAFPHDIINSFDFDVCRAAVLSEDEILADFNAGLLEAKILSINNPMRSLKRVLKYYKRGVGFADWELIKLFQAWDATSPERKAKLIELAQPEEPEPEYYNPEDRDHYRWDEDEYFDGE